MGTLKNKVKKKPKAQCTTGTRKTAKVARNPQPESPPLSAPLPCQLNLRGPAPPANDKAPPDNVNESAAAAALVSLGGRHQPLRKNSDPISRPKWITFLQPRFLESRHTTLEGTMMVGNTLRAVRSCHQIAATANPLWTLTTMRK
ncbi:hypothetical protein K438DRAFT_1784343 [Mycena galopus ATCC 62051]|nr:hypothetical protein K438DRAFT_1784343 [Mycena galopus ATCC 62051]